MKVACNLTIIVPVYNTSAFLLTCLESLCGEDPTCTEILLINDGSTDHSPDILAKFCQDKPWFRIIHQVNQGLSCARNTGLNQAQGRYIAFCDSDDFVLPGYYTHMTALAIKQDADMVLGNATYHFEGRQTDYPLYRDPLPSTNMTGQAWLTLRLRQKSLLHMVWMQVYKREMIERLSLRFTPGIGHEDVLWTSQALLTAQKIAFWNEPGYYYRQWKRNVQFSDKQLYYSANSYIVNSLALAEMTSHINDPELAHLMRWQLVDDGLSMFHKINKMSSSEIKRRCLREVWTRGVFGVLWRNATL
ncbi:MAG: glycosyltransferase, partial [Magnetococcales bacterium]|nr:glycosyltransferase [Magnetococcales bacterium]